MEWTIPSPFFKKGAPIIVSEPYLYNFTKAIKSLAADCP